MDSAGFFGRAALSVLMVAGAASADVVTADWTSITQFEYRLSKMPDLDQVRSAEGGAIGLPGDGVAYCAPTSVMNIIGYIARHGVSDLPPHAIDYETSVGFEYDAITLWIDDLGERMNTHPEDGTNTSQPGWEAYLAAHLGDDHPFILSSSYPTNSWYPRVHNVTRQAYLSGFVRFSYGRYIVSPGFGAPLLTRDSGHSVTLVGGRWNGGTGAIHFRNPATDEGDATTQAPFVTSFELMEPVTFELSDSAGAITADRMSREFDDDQLRILDCYTVIAPKAGFALSPTEVFPVNPQVLDGMIPDLMAPLTPTHGGPIVMGDLHWGGRGAILLHGSDGIGPAALTEYDPADGSEQVIAEVAGATAFGVSRHHELYVVTATDLLRIDGHTGVVLGSVPFANAVRVACDDEADEVLVLTAGAVPTLHRFGRDLTMSTVHPLAPQTPITAPTYFAWDPEAPGGCIVGTSGAPGSIYRLAPETGGTYQTREHILLAGTTVTSAAVDDAGHLFVCANGVTRELMPDGRGAMIERVDSSFAGVSATQFLIARSRSNFDPARHAGPEWNEVIDDAESEAMPERADCAGDVNLDGAVDFADLLIWTSTFGPCGSGPCLADVDDDGAVAFPDLLVILSAWGACP